MKKKLPDKTRDGIISLEIKPTDTVAWKLSMLMEAASTKDGSIEKIALKYGYTREHFYVIKNNYEGGGSEALRDKPQGPKSNHKRTDEIIKKIIRHRFLDPEANCAVIAQKMQQAGDNISQRSVERTIKEYGLAKKGYIKQLKQQIKRLKA